MTKQSSINAYRIGLTVLAVIALIIFAVVIDLASANNQDAQTQKTASKIGDKLNRYVNDKQIVPPSLTAAGINNVPANIHYAKESKGTYIFCVRYKSATSGSGIVDSLRSVLTGGFNDSSGSGGSEVFIDPSHDKGNNCQTIDTAITTATAATTPVVQNPYVRNADGSYTVCGVRTNYYETEGHVTRAYAPPSSSISLNATAAPYVGAYELVLIAPTSQIFDESCHQLQPTDLQLGNTVDVFNITSPNTSAVSILLKRSY